MRVPMTDLERQWADAAFVRVHCSYLVSLAHVTRIRLSADHPTVTVGWSTSRMRLRCASDRGTNCYRTKPASAHWRSRSVIGTRTR